MKVLVACEFSGVVRDAFIAEGHDAISCDIIDTDSPGPHYKGDVRDILDDGFDLMIAHPPCTYLANSGVRWLYGGKGTVIDVKRWHNMQHGAEFVFDLLNAPIPRIAVENPIMHKYAKEIIGQEPTQSIQPWQFGHPESKTTCLWLKNLPPLVPTSMLTLAPGDRWSNQTPSGQNKLGPSPDRWKLRSRTYEGIAQAMASQWGKL